MRNNSMGPPHEGSIQQTIAPGQEGNRIDHNTKYQKIHDNCLNGFKTDDEQ